MRLVPGLLTALLAFAALTPAAEGFDQTTRWYSLNVASAPSGKPLFLTYEKLGVRLEPYRSGDPQQMWALVWPDYPTAPAVTGSGGSPLDCISTDGIGCPFSGHAGNPLKIVNRATGGCLVFGGKTGVTTAPCEISAARQIWEYDPPKGIDSLINGGKCVTAVTSRPTPDNLVAAPGDCHAGGWIQHFAKAMSGEISCTTLWPFNLCFHTGKN